ncbi:MAG: bile acid:sodium symporter family protein [Bryobacterales bacterium]|nr:bile acid:sodium symporter family protein [Bryobacterales bacterium]
MSASKSNATAQGNRLWLILSAIGAAAFAAGWAGGAAPAVFGVALVAAMAFFALYCRTKPSLHVFTFTFWVLAFTTAAMFHPAWFDTWGGFKLSRLNTLLIQLVMFGMGATLSVGDFLGALKMPKAVIIGILLQFTIMPVTGYVIATAFGFEPEVAAGIVLIGSCSGGLASNVMVFLARGNVALSVTMTACSTLVAPLATPLAMKLLAGRLIEISFWAMMLSIINIVIIPIVGGLIANTILERKRGFGELLRLLVPATAAFVAGVTAATAFGQAMAGQPATQGLATQAIWLTGISLLAGMLFNAFLAGHRDAFDRFLPIVSMAAICFILAIIAASSRELLLSMGLVLLVAACLHNCVGYLLGYLLSGLAGLPEQDRRTVAFEVGMQNGGMGVGLAMDVLKSPAAALAPGIFGTWMNITGSMLAGWWRDRPVEARER